MSLEGKLIALLLSIIIWAASVLGGYLYGINACETSEKAADAAQLETAVENNRLIQRANDAKNLRISQDYEKRIDELQAKSAALTAADNAAGGLRISSKACESFMPAAASSNAGNNAPAPASIQLPPDVERFLREQADRCDAIVEQARSAQQWALEHGFVPQ